MKKIWCLVLAITILTSTVFAASTKDKLNATKSEIKNVQTQINKNEKEQKDTLTEISNLDSSINSTERQIDGIEKEIKELEESIVIAEENIKYSQEQYDGKYELRKNRMVAYYKNGNVSLQDLVNEASDQTDKMYMERIIEKIVSYDTSVMEELEKEKKNLEEKKTKLEQDSLKCADLKKDLEIRLASLEETVEKRTQYLSKLEKDHTALEKAEKELNAEADKLAKELAAQASNSKTSTYKGGKMTWPLPGHRIITSKFGNRLHPVLKKYSLHTGVDIAGSGCNGDPVVAAAAGTVIKATYSNAYGNYVVIDHGGGITTLYAHSSKLVVKAGDKVSAGQEIMKVGTTGYSTGPHLHFEVRKNGNYLNPLDGWIKA
ncbi:MAG: peptidoglycan DD-metalloendopeptidase family protein [Clostridia bacterium]|nr:peptidoglycan DD-metalloendopeptidase family protein [Clostridia bacterium]